MSKKKELEKVHEEMDEQQEKSDLYQKSSRVGMLVGLAVCLVLTVVKLLIKQPWQDVGLVYCSIFCSRYLYLWAKQKKNSSMICAVLWGIGAAVLLILYLIAIL